MPTIHIYKRVSRPVAAFRDRSHAGAHLAQFMNAGTCEDCTVFALPRGGVPVAAPISERLGCPLQLAMVRKLPVPTAPEVGFGALALDGSAVLNHHLVDHFGIHPSAVASVSHEVQMELRRRAATYPGREAIPSISGKTVYLVDDGLATGYTAIAAAQMIGKLHPEALVLCVPVSPWDSLVTVRPYFQEIYVMYVQERAPFSVAAFYRDFSDVPDDEVKEIIASTQRANH